MIDLRSDTVTRPVPAMLRAMSGAALGDDVFGDDPTVNRLQEKAADLLGKEAAIFCPSGTMTNQIAIKLHTRPLDELICDKTAHIANYESAGPAFHSGVSLRLIKGDRGRISPQQVLQHINPEDDHKARTRLVCIENSCNKAGGSYYELHQAEAISRACKEKGLALHLDGARLFNACLASGDPPAAFGKTADTLSICLSKGLGAPVGSLLAGSRDMIREARRIRKVLGGGMRQAGVLAAAGIYALDHHIERLAEDHQRARALASALDSMEYVEEVLPVETNIIIFELKAMHPAGQFLEQLKEAGILAVSMGGQMLRFVTHLDFTDEMLWKTIEELKKIPVK